MPSPDMIAESYRHSYTLFAARRPGESFVVMKRLALLLLLLPALIGAMVLLTSGGRSCLALPGTTERVSVDSGGNEGNGRSETARE